MLCGYIYIYIYDADLMITQSSNPHAKNSIPKKPSKLGLIGMWHNENLFQDTNIIRIRNHHPTNTNSRTRSILKTLQDQL